MQASLFIFLSFALQGLCLLFCERVARKEQGDGSAKGYFLAGKALTFFPLTIAFFAGRVAGGVILGCADAAYLVGWQAILYPMGIALGLFILGSGIGARLASFPVATVAQLMEVCYGSKSLRKLAAVVSVTSLFFILVAQIVASRALLHGAGIESIFVFFAFWAVIVLYTAIGGLRGVILSEIVQTLFLVAVFALVLLYVFVQTPTAIFHEALPSINTTSLIEAPLQKWISLLMMPMLFILIRQDMGQRCLAGKSGVTVALASCAAGLFTLCIAAIPIFMGVLGSKLSIPISPELPTVFMRVLRETTPPWLQTLAGCALLSAIISNATSMMNSIGSNLFNDFLMGSTIIPKKILMRLAIIITSLAAFGVVFFCQDILQLIVYGCEVSVCCFFVLVMWALFFKKGHTLSAYFSIIGGGTILALGHALQPGNHVWAAVAIVGALLLFLATEGILRAKMHRPS